MQIKITTARCQIMPAMDFLINVCITLIEILLGELHFRITVGSTERPDFQNTLKNHYSTFVMQKLGTEKPSL